MKDFAKSIRVGNAYTKGQVLGEEEGKKYVFSGEINGTYIVHRQPDGKTFSFSSEQEIKDWMRNSKIGNRNVGNSATFDRLDNAIHYASNLADNALRRLSSPYSATNIVSDLSKCKQACDEAIKLAIQYDKERNQAGNSKTNNETIDPSDAELRKLEDELRGWLKMYDSKDPNVDKANVEKNIRAIRADIEKYKRKHKIWNESIDKQEWTLFKGLKKDAEKEIGNADTVSEYNAEIQRLTNKAEQLRRMGQGRLAMEIEKQIEKLGKEMRELGNKKVGNGTPGSIASIGPAWMHGGTVYGKMDTDESGKRHNEYVKITWLGEGKGGVANYFIDDRMQSDKFGSIDKNELKRWAESKIGNEDKFDKKYGKVMEEFFDGKLKSGSGEKVTDPEQAKAIAYSEADKVDNLKRARNAMNKKCGNLQITLWKGNDTVLISEDGTVQYLESNSFEVDRDKYDSQQMAIEEMTKKGYRKK